MHIDYTQYHKFAMAATSGERIEYFVRTLMTSWSMSYYQPKLSQLAGIQMLVQIYNAENLAMGNGATARMSSSEA